MKIRKVWKSFHFYLKDLTKIAKKISTKKLYDLIFLFQWLIIDFHGFEI